MNLIYLVFVENCNFWLWFFSRNLQQLLGTSLQLIRYNNVETAINLYFWLIRLLSYF
jgi:hypothetical protein